MGKKNIAKQGTHKTFIPIRSALDQAFSDIDNFHEDENAKSDLSSGYEFLNNLFVSREGPRFSIVSIPTEVGGSKYFGGSIITELAIQFKSTIGCFSMQVSSAYYSSIMLSIVSNVDHHLMRSGRLPSERWPDLSKAAGQIAETNIYIDDYRTQSVATIRKSAMQMLKESELDLLVIDNLQHMLREHKQGRRALEYQQICLSLRELSEELDVSILLMSEFSDEYDPDDFRSASDCTQLTTLQEYSRIADAELCLIPGDSDENERPINLHLYRNREGFTGTIELRREYPGGGFKNRKE